MPRAAVNVLLLENIHPTAKDQLGADGMTVDLHVQSYKEDEIIAKLAGVQVLGIRSKTKLTQRLLESETPKICWRSAASASARTRSISGPRTAGRAGL